VIARWFSLGAALLGIPGEAIADPRLDIVADAAMAQTGAQGLALAVVEPGRVVAQGAWGKRNAKGEPLTTETVMYGASLTKAVFAALVIELAGEGRLDLDAPIARMLPKPLPEFADPEERFAPWPDLASDPRWAQITPRHVLTHSTGFANFSWLSPDRKLTIHFNPGSRYAYSGDGMILLQFALEQGLGIDVGHEMQRRLFDRYRLTRTSLQWRPDFADHLADGWTAEGSVELHDRRDNVRVAGSMDTTLSDMGRLWAGLLADRPLLRTMARPGLPITTAAQFPTLQPELPRAKRDRKLAAGLGVVTFTGPQGPGFYKGGHNDSTGNMVVCLLRRPRCVVILSNDVRAEAAFPAIVLRLLGHTGVPWTWEYGEHSWTKSR
jgi:CubicO group peptidase (beta-lactamase class C family)